MNMEGLTETTGRALKEAKKTVNVTSIPEAITNGIEKLNQLVQDYPEYIPLPKLAEFLHANAEGLRYSIERGQCPFGIGWQKSATGNKAFKVPTVTFYLWYTNGGIFKG